MKNMFKIVFIFLIVSISGTLGAVYLSEKRHDNNNRNIMNNARHNQDTNMASIDIQTGPYTKNIIATIKEGEPYILVDILPEVERFISYPIEIQKDYLRKRALQICQESINKKNEFLNYETIKLRMIMVNDSDEYGRGNWAMAPELAVFILKNTNKIMKIKVHERKAIELNEIIREQKFNSEYIKE